MEETTHPNYGALFLQKIKGMYLKYVSREDKIVEEEGAVDVAVDAVVDVAILGAIEMLAPLKPRNKVMNKVMFLSRMNRHQVLDVECVVDCRRCICAPCTLVVCRRYILRIVM